MLRGLVPFENARQPTRMGPTTPSTFGNLQREINRMFDDFWRDGLMATPETGIALRDVDVDVRDLDKEIRVEAELPGLREEDIDVTLHNGVLTIGGEKSAETEDRDERNGRYYLAERTYGAFRRDIPLTAEVDEDAVKAEFKNGVLTISLPKTEEAQADAKRIPVKGE